MKVRTIAGLGMTLLAAGLMTIYLLNPDFPNAWLRSDSADEAEVDAESEQATPDEIDEFLVQYNATYRALWTDAATAKWNSLTDASPDNIAERQAARMRLDDFNGGVQVVEKLRMYRDRVDLSSLQDRQIETAWRFAARRPSRSAEAVDRLQELSASLRDTLSRHAGRAPSLQDPERRLPAKAALAALASERDTTARRAIWEGLVELGPHLKDDLIEVRDLRNLLAREMGYSSYFELQAADYDLTAPEMILLLDQIYASLEPLYRQLHCWVKHELAQRYGAETPRRIPIHWLDSPLGTGWSGILEPADLDTHFRDVQRQWIVEEAERFYGSLGFDSLPLTFWGRSDLMPVEPGSGQRKNPDPQTVHLNLGQDVRLLVQLEPDFDSYLTAHRQLGIAYSQLATDRDDLPPILRRGACRAMPLAIAELAELAARQVPYLEATGVLPPQSAPEAIRELMSRALEGVITTAPAVLGTAAHWEYDFYEKDLPRHQINTRWWEYAARFQGIEAPTVRGEDDCDPAAQPGIHEHPARGYDAVLGTIIAHQLYRYLCRDVLKQDLHEAQLAGNRNAGRFLRSILETGAAREWSVILRQATGEELSAEALIEYYQPLQEWLEIQNQGRDPGF